MSEKGRSRTGRDRHQLNKVARQAIWRRNMASASDRVTPAMASSGQSRARRPTSRTLEEDP